MESCTTQSEHSSKNSSLQDELTWQQGVKQAAAPQRMESSCLIQLYIFLQLETYILYQSLSSQDVYVKLFLVF